MVMVDSICGVFVDSADIASLRSPEAVALGPEWDAVDGVREVEGLWQCPLSALSDCVVAERVSF